MLNRCYSKKMVNDFQERSCELKETVNTQFKQIKVKPKQSTPQ